MLHGGDGVDAAIHAHIDHLRLVRDAGEGDNSPVLEFEGRDGAQLRLRPGQVTHEEAAADLLQGLALLQAANIAQALSHLMPF